jgi:hypothetical protein
MVASLKHFRLAMPSVEIADDNLSSSLSKEYANGTVRASALASEAEFTVYGFSSW